MNKESFYGRRKRNRDLQWKVRLSKKEREYHSSPMPSSYIARLSSPSGHWKVFHRQSDAFQFARSHSKELHVFAFESESFLEKQGQRLFLVASYEHFWHYYRQMNRRQRHHYEVIPEGSVCHLYFDIEFQKALNADTDGNRVVKILIEYVCFQLQEKLGISCSAKNVLVLGASTEKKFSQHLIFHLAEAAFKCNVHAGDFVHEIFSELLEVINTKCIAVLPQDKSNLWNPVEDTSEVASLSEEQSPNVDNSCFLTSNSPCIDSLNSLSDPSCDKTILLDSDKERPLELAGCSLPCSSSRSYGIVNSCNSSQITCKNEASELGFWLERFLSDSTLTLEDLKSLQVVDKNGKKTFIVDLGVYTKNRNFRLYLSCKMGQDNPLSMEDTSLYVCKPSSGSRISSQQQIFLDSLVANVQYSDDMQILIYRRHNGRASERSAASTSSSKMDANDVQEGFEHSPYPRLDEFITDVVQNPPPGALPGHIRRWTFFNQGKCLIYEIARNRWCGNIQRAHKSNKIMIVVDLRKRVYYQKCFDPDCKAIGYKSPDHLLPRYTLPAVFTEEEAWDDMSAPDDLCDDDLLSAVGAVETQLQWSDDDMEEELLQAAEEAELNASISSQEEPLQAAEEAKLNASISSQEEPLQDAEEAKLNASISSQ